MRQRALWLSLREEWDAQRDQEKPWGRGGGDSSGDGDDGPIRGREEERRKEGREDEGGNGSVLHLGV